MNKLQTSTATTDYFVTCRSFAEVLREFRMSTFKLTKTRQMQKLQSLVKLFLAHCEKITLKEIQISLLRRVKIHM